MNEFGFERQIYDKRNKTGHYERTNYYETYTPAWLTGAELFAGVNKY